MRKQSGIPLALVAGAAMSVPVLAEASTVYTFRFDSGNNLYYDSTFTLGTQTSANSWGIASVDSSGVIEIGGQTRYWSGSSTGSFSWDNATHRLHVSYSVAGSGWSMTLANVSFTQGTSAEGLPMGHLFGGVGSTTDAPNLNVGGADYPFLTSNLSYFNSLVGEGNPVPGEGAIAALIGIGLASQRRRRSS